MSPKDHDYIDLDQVRRNQRQRRFELVPFDKIILAPGRNYLIKGLIPREGLVVVWGPPKCGKTFWVYDLVMHIALGREYRGRRVLPGPVVYVAVEGERGLAARTEAFRREKMAEESSGTKFFLLTSRLDLVADAANLVADIGAQIGTEPCVAVVIDTLNRTLTGSESSDEDMQAYIKAADTIRAAFACAVIVIHHCGIDDKRPRGHTSLLGAVDAQIAVKRGADDVISTLVEYMKDGETGAEVFSRLKVVDLDRDEDGERVTSCVLEPVERGSGAASPQTTAKPAKLPNSAKTALELLRKAIADDGKPAPANNHIPAAAIVVRADIWRRYCYAGTVSETDTPEAKRKAFNRSCASLQAAGVIGIWNDLVWTIAP